MKIIFGGGGKDEKSVLEIEFTVLVNLISPPLEKKVDLPVRKNFFDAALKRCSEDHFYMSFSSRKCISGQN